MSLERLVIVPASVTAPLTGMVAGVSAAMLTRSGVRLSARAVPLE